jgi:[acyl-carrier-protein] S-malonyltransferase
MPGAMSKRAWLFPGQGSQVVGMGQKVLASSARARAVFERADEALGESLSKIILEGPLEILTLTANAQPALVTTCFAILEALREHGELAAPDFAAGHSLGEYTALVAAGALRFEDAVRIVRARGLAMQDAVPVGVGAMAAILSLDEAVLAEICAAACQGQRVELANFNSPGQIVIAGDKAAVERASAAAGAAKGRAIPLPVSAPFHSSLMKPAAERLAKVLEAVEVGPLAFPVVANFDAAPNADPARVKQLLVQQVDGAVRWEQSVRFLESQGVTEALEIGPGKVLAGMVKRTAKSIQVTSLDAPVVTA